MRHPPQELDRVAGGAITEVTTGVVIAIAAGVLIAWGLGRCTARGPALPPTTTALPAEVNAMELRVFAVEAQGLDDNRRADAYLGRYGWVDARARTVHVPIEVAYRLYLARRRAKERR